MEKCVEHS